MNGDRTGVIWAALAAALLGILVFWGPLIWWIWE